MKKKHISINMLIVLLSLMSAFGPMSIDLYLPALPAIAEDLQASKGAIQLSVTGFLLGLCIGMLIYGPLSDKFGRKKIILIGSLIYIVASVICLLAQSADQLVIARLFQAFGAGGCIVMARTIVRDVFRGNQVARILSVMQVIIMIAPLLAPVLGSFVLKFFGWRSLFLVLLFFGVLNFLLTFFYLPETYAKSKRSTGSILSTFGNYKRIFKKRASLGYILSGAIPSGITFGFITGSPFLYIEYYGINPQHFSLLFGFNIAGIMSMVALNIWLLKTRSIDKILLFAFVWLGLSSLLMLIFGAHSLAAFVVLTLMMMGIIGLIGSNCAAQIMNLNSQYAGSAMALNSSSQFAIGALVSIIVGLFYKNYPTSLGIIMAICGLLTSAIYFLLIYPIRNKNLINCNDGSI